MTGLRPEDPATIGQFRLLRRLGVGGMGVVYLAEGRHGRVALKVVRPELGDDATFRTRFRREVQASFRVQGPSTVRLLDFDTEAEQPWMAVDYIDGPPLSELVPRSGPLSPQRQFALAVALADALLEIHDHGLIHRDLKPDNVLCPADGPKVIDLGIAAAVDAVRLTAVGSVLGAPGWLSPEQVETGKATAASDIFAWGCTIGYAACGRLPFGEGAPHMLFYRVLNQAPDVDFGLLAPPLRSLVAGATEHDPTTRPTSAKLLERLLERAELPGTIDRTKSVLDVLRRDWQGLPLTKSVHARPGTSGSASTAAPPTTDEPQATVIAPPQVRVTPARPRTPPVQPASVQPASVQPASPQPPPASPIQPVAMGSPGPLPAGPFPPAPGIPTGGPLLGPGPFAGHGLPDAAFGPSVAAPRRSRRPLLIAVLVVLVIAAVVAGIVLLTSGGSDPAPPLGTPAGVRATAANDGIDLRWDSVPSARSYRVLSDGKVVADNVSGTTYRVGVGTDTALHQYSVVALGGSDRSSAPSAPVASAALGPWGSAAPLHTTFPRIVPADPKQKGADGQTCSTIPSQRDKHAIDIISCTYPNGVYLEALHYPSNVARGDREDEIRAVADTPTTWSTTGGGDGGALYLGHDDNGPWRWWTFNQKAGFAMYAQWSSHTADQLKQWWKDAPF